MFAELWRNNADAGTVAELSNEDLEDLWARWFRPFVGTGQGDGWLDRVDIADERVRTHLAGDFTGNVTALCWLAIRPGRHRRERVVAWQPYLSAAFDRDLLDVNDDVAEYLTAVVGHVVTADRVTEDLLEAIAFIDDALWCDQTAVSLGLTHLALQATSAGQHVRVRLQVQGSTTPSLTHEYRTSSSPWAGTAQPTLSPSSAPTTTGGSSSPAMSPSSSWRTSTHP